MSDCRFGVSPVNYPDPDPYDKNRFSHDMAHFQINIGRTSAVLEGKDFVASNFTVKND